MPIDPESIEELKNIREKYSNLSVEQFKDLIISYFEEGANPPTDSKFGINSQEQAITIIRQGQIAEGESIRDVLRAVEYLKQNYMNDHNAKNADVCFDCIDQLKQKSSAKTRIMDRVNIIVSSDLLNSKETEERISRRLESL